MYYCTDCKKKFFDPKIYFERHGLDSPPYEKIMLCPYCESEDIAYIEARHCKCCGARLSYDNKGDYCNKACETRGKRLFELEAKRRKLRLVSPLYAAVRAVEEYNKEHGTNLSYGTYYGTRAGNKNES